MSENATPLKSTTRFSLKSIVISLFILGFVVGGGYYLYQYLVAQDIALNPNKALQMEIADTVKKVGTLIELPTGEQPTVATVSEKEKLKGQEFFKKAENGDRVLIYVKSKQAYLYRPSSNKIITVGPINVQANADSNGTKNTGTVAGAATQQTATAPRVAIYNGTKIAGLAGKTEEALQSKGLSVNVVEKTNAVGNDYKKTLVVDLTGKNTAAAEQLAGALKGEVGVLPQGEIKPQADFLIIAAQ